MTAIDRPSESPVVSTPGVPAPRRQLKRPSPLAVAEAATGITVAACVLVVHDVAYLLGVPYWLDEAWVADSTRVPLGQLTTVTSTSPIGWTFLLRLVPGSGQQDQRLIPLLFAGLTVLAAYEFGRSLRLFPLITGLLAGGAALLVPAMLVSDDLKEYTTDAFVTVLGMALMSRLEARWSRRRLVVLAVTLMASAFVSHATLFVAAAALPCLTVAQLARRRWRQFAEAAVATAATGAVLSVIFVLFDSGTQTAAVRKYWSAYYLPHRLSAAVHYIYTGVHRLLPYFGIGHASLLVVLVVLGLAVLVWQGRPATAALLPTVALGLVLLSALKKYPLLDERTSTFLITASVVVAAIGVAGVVTILARKVHILAGIAAASAIAVFYILAAFPYVNDHPIPVEDVRAQAAYVTSHERPDDVVLVSLGASYGYAYYAPPRPEVVKSTGIGFSVIYPAADRIVALGNRRPIDVQSGLAEALAMAAGHPGTRLWIVLNHVSASEQVAWNAALARLPIHLIYVAPNTIVRYLQVDS